jgi:nucleoid-associated protein YgaU
VRPVPAADNTHTVVAGDNLWTIAAAELSRQSGRTPDHLAEAEIRNYWIKVIDANRGRLLSGNPNLIYPGEQIVRPPAD